MSESKDQMELEQWFETVKQKYFAIVSVASPDTVHSDLPNKDIKTIIQFLKSKGCSMTIESPNIFVIFGTETQIQAWYSWIINYLKNMNSCQISVIPIELRYQVLDLLQRDHYVTTLTHIQRPYTIQAHDRYTIIQKQRNQISTYLDISVQVLELLRDIIEPDKYEILYTHRKGDMYKMIIQKIEIPID